MIVKIEDIIKYLEKFDPKTEVHLDKDGWIEYLTVEENIEGILQICNIGNKQILFINN